MISHITDVIKKNSHWLQNPHAELSFLKVSTPASGKELNQGKVLIFVFEEGQKIPTLCVKTTRTYESGGLIKRNHSNLKYVTSELEDTDLSSLFARPLYMHDDGKHIFCIESVCPGDMFSSQEKSIDLVFDRYTTWQVYLAKKAKKNLKVTDLNKIAHDFIEALPVTDTSREILKNYNKSLLLDLNITLPEITQHGDMTPDNVLVAGETVYLIDYDFVGLSTIPGFDFFHFLSKSQNRTGSFKAVCRQYFPAYFKALGSDVTHLEPLFFIYYLQESLRKGVGEKSGEEIVRNFESLMERP